MTPSAGLWLRAKEIVGDALELPADQRAALLDVRCGGDDALRAEVEAFLHLASDTAEFLSPIGASLASFVDPAGDQGGKLFGAYRLLREIGRGGMSVVYLAERADGAYQQQVAVKLMLAATAADAAKRVGRERQALAVLDHPNIARLIDGGASTDGVPFLVMDYVDGERIDDWCERQHLDVAARVALAVSVCAAVQHAHQQLIVHRDIKPANILITQQGNPKLLDFGVARLLESATALEVNDLTQAGSLLFTPRYASPEQVRGLPVSVSTDVYGLGVLLYEILGGSSPFINISSQSATNAAAAMRAVLEDECRPASKVAEQFAPERAALLRGDLDLILAKACAREAKDRYATVALLGDDLRRWLGSEPISAKPATWGYIARKFVMRHRLSTAVSAALVVSLIGGSAAIIWKSNQAQQQRALAEKRFDDVRKLAGKVLFDYYDEASKLQNSLLLREKLASDGVGYLDALSVDAGDNLDLLQELASGFERLGAISGRTFDASKGQPAIARENFGKAIFLREKIYRLQPQSFAASAALASTLAEMADLEGGQGSGDKAAELSERGIKVLQPHIVKNGVGASLPASLTLARLLRVRAAMDSCAGPNTRGRSAEATQLLKSNMPFFEALVTAQGSSTESRGDHASVLVEYGMTALCRGDFATASKTLHESMRTYIALQTQTKEPQRHQMSAAMVEIELATIEWSRGDYAHAAQIARSAFARMRPLVSESPGDAGLQLRWLVVAAKTANFIVIAGSEQDQRDAPPYLREAQRTAQQLLAQNPSNQFAHVLATSVANAQNVLTAMRGAGADAISAQQRLIAEWEKSMSVGNTNAVGLQARLYSSLARMYPVAERALACAALDQALAIKQKLLLREPERLRDAFALIEDAAQAQEWDAPARPCVDPRYRGAALEHLAALNKRGVKHLALAGLAAKLR